MRKRAEGAYNSPCRWASPVHLGNVGWVGFEPNAVQSEAAKGAIVFLMSVVQGVSYIAGALVFLRFGFNESEHARTRSLIEARNSRSHRSESI